MEKFFIYMLQVNISLMVACLVYFLLLRNLTFFKLNRFYLIASILLSATVPYFMQQIAFEHQIITNTIESYAVDWKAMQQNLKDVCASTQYTWKDWLLIGYWIGVTSMAVLFIGQIWSLFRIHKLAKNNTVNPDIFLTDAAIHPFSFLKNIYINPNKHSNEDIDTIIHHERIHTSGWHSLDLILAEVNKIFFWFNPGAWFMKLAITENLEFIADQLVLQKGSDKKQYQYQLLKALVNKNVLNNSIANQFSFIQLKNRIKMMNKKHSPSYNRLRYALTIPMLAIVSLLFANKTTEVASIKDAFKYMMTQDTIIKTAKSYTHIKVIENDKMHVAMAYDEKGQEISKINLRNASKAEISIWNKKYGRTEPHIPPAPPRVGKLKKVPEPPEPMDLDIPAAPAEPEDVEDIAYNAEAYSYHYDSECNCEEKDTEINKHKHIGDKLKKYQEKQAQLNAKMMETSSKYQAEIQKQLQASTEKVIALQMKQIAKQQEALAKQQEILAKQQVKLMIEVQKNLHEKSKIETIENDEEEDEN
jgi:hypothetical protein